MNLIDHVHAYVARCDQANNGSRNNAAFNIAGHCAAFRMAVTGETLGERDILDIMRSWNLRNPEPLEETELAATVHSALTSGTPREPKIVEARKAKAASKNAKPKPPREPSGELIVNPSAPLETARRIILVKFTREGVQSIAHHRGSFLIHRGTHYREVEDAAIRNDTYGFLEHAEQEDSEGKRAPFNPNKSKVDNIIDALKSIVHMDAAIDSPSWIGDCDPSLPEASDLLPCSNGLLDVMTENLLSPNPSLFATAGVDYPYDKNATCPLWLKHLDQWMPGDPGAIGTLQEWFGLCLTTDTSFQKALAIIGPKRSGKGTMMRMLASTIGPANVAAPTLSGLASHFGLSGLLHRTVATINDARLSGRTDQAAVVERLLSITGEDFQTIDIKHKHPITCRLPVRFVLVSNELPRLNDISGALASRFIMLQLNNSFYGREDQTLTDRLMHERPGVLRWALEGLRRLRKRGHFVQPASGEDAMAELDDLSSPVGAFIREQCELGPQLRIETDSLYAAWTSWCEREGKSHVTDKATFGRDLRAAAPIRRRRNRSAELTFYDGIDLANKVQSLAVPRDLPMHVTHAHAQGNIERNRESLGTAVDCDAGGLPH